MVQICNSEKRLKSQLFHSKRNPPCNSILKDNIPVGFSIKFYENVCIPLNFLCCCTQQYAHTGFPYRCTQNMQNEFLFLFLIPQIIYITQIFRLSYLYAKIWSTILISAQHNVNDWYVCGVLYNVQCTCRKVYKKLQSLLNKITLFPFCRVPIPKQNLHFKCLSIHFDVMYAILIYEFFILEFLELQILCNAG